jgi:methylenetetrahydrofolate reductase (NADPH)
MEESDHGEAKTVDDLDEVELIEALKTLQTGKDISGFDLDGAPRYSIGCTIAPFVDDRSRDAALADAGRKIAAGAEYVITPPIFDLAGSTTFLTRTQDLGVPVIATVFLIKSLAIAQYIANSDPSARMTDDLIQRIRKSADREGEGIKLAGETVAAMQKLTQGVLIQTLGWENRLSKILDIANL